MSIAGGLRSLAINLAVLAATTAVTLVVGELVVRNVMPQALYRFPNGMFAGHPKIKFVLAPKFEGVASTTEYSTVIRTNAEGFREDKEYGAKTPGTQRIVAIGDSFTMGVGVEAPEAFTKVLERRLNEHGHAVEIVNTGVPGFNTAQQLGLLEERGPALQPDLVLLAFFIGNDVVDNPLTDDVLIVDGTVRAIGSNQGLLPTTLRYWLQRHSHLFVLVRSIWLGSRQTDEQRREAAVKSLSIYLAKPDEAMEKTWRVSEALLAQFAELGNRLGARTAVLLIPERPGMVAPEWEARVAALDAGSGTYARDYPNKRLGRYLSGLGVPTLDLFDTFTTQETASSDYFKIDGHWTVQGNARAAERIEQFLVGEGLVP